MNCKQVIVVRKDLNMRKGKIAAQVAHASMAFLLEHEGYPGVTHFGSPDKDGARTGNLHKHLDREQHAWLTDPESAHAKVVVGCDSEQELADLVLKAAEAGITVHQITDAGRTEFGGIATLTAVAFGPHEVSRFVGLTDHLKLL